MQFQFITWALKEGESAYPLSYFLILGNLKMLSLIQRVKMAFPECKRNMRELGGKHNKKGDRGAHVIPLEALGPCRLWGNLKLVHSSSGHQHWFPYCYQF